MRVHVGSAAAQSARAVNARAYTVGRDVVFGEGEYVPGSSGGRRLLAHELVHTLQQSTSRATTCLQCTNGQEVYLPTEEALSAVVHAYSMMTENIWFDSWGNDLRDNDLDGTVDNSSERGLPDGIHYHGGTRPYSANICPLQFLRTDQCPGFMQNSINIYYKVCIDVPKESYSSAGISMPSTRSIAAIIPWFRGNSKFQTWTKPSLPNVMIPGDFIAAQSGGHSHSGLVPSFGLPKPWFVSAIHLPGPTSRRSLGGQFTYWPSCANDVFRTPWPFNIDFVARYKG